MNVVNVVVMEVFVLDKQPILLNNKEEQRQVQLHNNKQHNKQKNKQ